MLRLNSSMHQSWKLGSCRKCCIMRQIPHESYSFKTELVTTRIGGNKPSLPLVFCSFRNACLYYYLLHELTASQTSYQTWLPRLRIPSLQNCEQNKLFLY
jgi:hypothetical protein